MKTKPNTLIVRRRRTGFYREGLNCQGQERTYNRQPPSTPPPEPEPELTQKEIAWRLFRATINTTTTTP